MRRKAQRNLENDYLIKRYGNDILHSEEFKDALAQTHHHRSSVGDHSIHTARAGLTMCNVISKAGIHIDERKIVRISLLHDLGILGREEKYKSSFECGYRHPKDSTVTAKKLWHDIDQKSIRAIRSHMWPLSPTMPTSKEAFILCIADKATAIGDRFNKKDRRINSPVFA